MLLALVALMAVLLPSGPTAIDRAWSEAMVDIRAPALRSVALAFNWLGRGLGRALTIAAIAAVLGPTRRWLALLAFAVAETVAPLLSDILKAVVERPRPHGALVHAAGSSFPSGHAAYGGTTCVALVLLFTAPGRRRAGWWALAALGIAGMAWSRTYLHVHWLSDVVAGALLGIAVALLVFGIAQLRSRLRA